MNCNTIREELIEVAGGSPATPEVAAHLRSCSGCVESLQKLQQTMALMDEWVVPEPSPYFDTRLQARLREERSQQRRGIFEWLRRPALAVVATVIMVAAVALFNVGGPGDSKTGNTPSTERVMAQQGTAVGDLQLLDKNSEILSDFDALDALDGTTADDTVAN